MCTRRHRTVSTRTCVGCSTSWKSTRATPGTPTCCGGRRWPRRGGPAKRLATELTPLGSVGLAADLETVLDERGCVIVDTAGVLIVTARPSALCLLPANILRLSDAGRDASDECHVR